MNGHNSQDNQNQPVSRRRIILGAAFAVGSGFLRSGRAFAAVETEISRTAEAIHQEIVFKASRKRVYEALTDTKQFDRVSHMGAAAKAGAPLDKIPTEMSGAVGGTFTIFGGHIIGRQLELLPGERIVQAWRVVDWSPGIYSIARYELVEEGAVTRIKFEHTGFPTGLAEHLAEGWRGNYWEPLEKYFG